MPAEVVWSLKADEIATRAIGLWIGAMTAFRFRLLVGFLPGFYHDSLQSTWLTESL